MRDLQGRRAIVTGAGGGLGRALALELARAGCPLALSDVDEGALKRVSEEVAATGGSAHLAVLDVSDRAAVRAYADRLQSEAGPVHLLVNNAGVCLVASIEEMAYEDLRWLMDINYWGVVHLTQAFLPYLQQADQARVVNISSIFGMVGLPTQAAYCSAKFAVHGFTETLQLELEATSPHVRASLVVSGGLKTRIAHHARVPGGRWVASTQEWADTFDQCALTTPEVAARTIVRGIRRGSRRILVGADSHVVHLLQRIIPGGYRAGVARFSRRMLDQRP